MIPKLLHLIWVGSEFPSRFQPNLASWMDHHPTWSVQLWGEDTRPKLRNENLYRHAEQYVRPDAVGQFRADLLRYELLYLYGGFYADVDTYPLRSIDLALVGRSEFAVREDPRWIGNTYLGATPGHPTFDKLIGVLESRVPEKAGQAATVVSGPQFLTPIWAEDGCYVSGETEKWFPYSWRDVRAGTVPSVEPDVYAVHQWQHSERKR